MSVNIIVEILMPMGIATSHCNMVLGVIIACRGPLVRVGRAQVDLETKGLTVDIKVVDFKDLEHCRAWVELLDMYASDPMGGGSPLPDDTKARACGELANWPGALSLIAWDNGEAVGLLNAFVGFSTFKARPLMNVHDIAVKPQWRGRGVGKALMAELERQAIDRGCCKLTLEVLTGNQRARDAYLKFGFEDYALDPNHGIASFMQKWL